MSETVTIRPARPEEADALSALAWRSKGHWGYDAAFMASCREALTVGAEAIIAGRVFIAWQGGAPRGFYQLDIADDAADVGLFFVEPGAIRSGIGRALWRHLSAEAARRGRARITVESDPNAVGFYEAMGARRIGSVPSESIPGRTLPLLEQRLG